MKKLLFLIIISLPFQIFAAQRSLECVYPSGGYDDEFIYVIADGDTVKSFEYIPYWGEGGNFVEVQKNVFQKYETGVILTSILTFSDDLRSATLVIVYVNGGAVHQVQNFTCEDKIVEN